MIGFAVSALLAAVIVCFFNPRFGTILLFTLSQCALLGGLGEYALGELGPYWDGSASGKAMQADGLPTAVSGLIGTFAAVVLFVSARRKK